jgi:hypothetical protein
VAKFDGLLESTLNPLLFLNPLMTQEAVLSSKIEGTQASLSEVLAFEAEIFYLIGKNTATMMKKINLYNWL